MRLQAPAVLWACVSAANGLGAQVPDRAVAFVNVNVVPMDTERVLEGQTIVVRNGRITAFGPAAQVEVPTEARAIDASGKYLMPGLADMHVHAWVEGDLLLFVANGITTVRNMFGAPLHLDWRQAISRGEMLGPELFTAGPIVDGTPPVWEGSTVVQTSAEATRAVAEQKAAGYDFIKVYARIKPDAYRALLAAANEQDIPVVGHVPIAVGLEGVLQAGQASIEHLDGFLYATATAASPFDSANWAQIPRGKHRDVEFETARALLDGILSFTDIYDDDKLHRLAGRFRDTGTWSVPTLVVFRYVSTEEAPEWFARPEMRYVNPQWRVAWAPVKDRYKGRSTTEVRSQLIYNEAKRRRVKALLDGGARVLLGTDTPNPLVIPGFSIHEELRNLVDAGLTPYQAIKAGTHDAAEFLGALDSLGTIAVGKVADLLLVGADPLADVANVREPIGVMVRGRWLPRSELEELLEELAESYRAR